jgi:hypothetical protein
MHQTDFPLIGWREWIALPRLGLQQIKAKIDTGATTSALHAFSLDVFKQGGKPKIQFSIHPHQRTLQVISCVADIIDVRWVTDSGGHREERYVIRTPVRLGERQWEIDITLTNRDTMAYRMLLGRTALRNLFIVDPAHSYLLSHKPKLKYP